MSGSTQTRGSKKESEQFDSLKIINFRFGGHFKYGITQTTIFSRFLQEKVQIWEMEINKVNRLYHLPCFSLQTISNITIHF